jgi:hypothetical protein
MKITSKHSNHNTCISYISLIPGMSFLDSSPAQEEPRFLMALRNVTALEGQSVKLICRVRGTPLPKIVWY